MRRALLFSVSLLAVAAMSVNADNVQQNVANPVQNVTLKKAPAKNSFMQVDLKKIPQNMKVNKGAFSLKSPKATAVDVSYSHLNLYVGMNTTSGSSYPHTSLSPAYQSTYFVNTTPDLQTGMSQWSYDTVEGSSTVTKTSNEDHLVVEYPFGIFNYPTLTVSGSSYQFGTWTSGSQTGSGLIVAGGSPENFMDDGFYGVMNCDPFYGENLMLLPSNTGEDAAWWQDIAEVNSPVTGFGTYIPYSGADYALSAVYLPCFSAEGDDTPIKINVREVNEEDGRIGDVIASGEAVLSEDAYSYFVNGGETRMIEFTFTENTGMFVNDVVPTISTGIFIELEIPETVTITPLAMMSLTAQPEYANFYTLYEDGSMFPANALSSEEDGVVYGGFFTFDIMYTWLNSTDGDYRFDAPVSGGSKTFNMDSYFIPDGWELTDTKDALYNWVEYDTTYDESTGAMTLTFNVDALDVNETPGRYTFVTASVPGASVVFTISQGDKSGVESVDASALVVTVENGNFVVKGSNASAVEVYNVSGQKVADAAVEGETVVDAQNLESGLYILKFNDNKVVKIVK